MHCRNCRHHLDRESRYCPRCGAPAAVDWPTAGAPWLRRPAAVAGLALLLVAWLFALQKALRQPETQVVSQPAAETSPNPQIARGPEPRSTTATAPPRPQPPTSQVAPARPRAAVRPQASRPRPERQQVARRATRPPARTVVSKPRDPQPATPPVTRPPAVRFTARPRPEPPATVRATRPPAPRIVARLRPAAVRAVRQVAVRPSRPVASQPRRALVQIASRRTPATPRRRTLLASAPIDPRRGQVRSWRQNSSARQDALTQRSTERRELVSARFSPDNSRPLNRRPDLVMQVSARPYGPKTYVYYNHGRLLGTTPLAIRFDRPGRHKLYFWTPSTRSRVTRWVTVGGRAPQRLTVRTGPSREFAGLR